MTNINTIIEQVDDLRAKLTELASTQAPSEDDFEPIADRPDCARLRWLWYRRADNGIEASGALVKSGGRVLVNRKRYASWLAGNRAA
jgi:hypothetical protein